MLVREEKNHKRLLQVDNLMLWIKEGKNIDSFGETKAVVTSLVVTDLEKNVLYKVSCNPYINTLENIINNNIAEKILEYWDGSKTEVYWKKVALNKALLNNSWFAIDLTLKEVNEEKAKAIEQMYLNEIKAKNDVLETKIKNLCRDNNLRYINYIDYIGIVYLKDSRLNRLSDEAFKGYIKKKIKGSDEEFNKLFDKDIRIVYYSKDGLSTKEKNSTLQKLYSALDYEINHCEENDFLVEYMIKEIIL